MKEIRMDWETFEKELKDEKSMGYRFSIWDITEWIEGKISLSDWMTTSKERGAYESCIIQLVKALGREDELIEEKEEKKNDSINK